MSTKFNLITEPDFVENSYSNILLINLSPEQKAQFQEWLKTHDASANIYIGSESNLDWTIDSHMIANVTVINLDNLPDPLKYFAAYFIKNPSTYYFAENFLDLWNLLNTKHIKNFDFLKEELI